MYVYMYKYMYMYVYITYTVLHKCTRTDYKYTQFKPCTNATL